MIRGGRGVASRCPSGSGATRAVDRALCFRSMIFFFSLTACFSIFAIARVSAMYMSALVSFAVNGMFSPVNYDFADLTILFDVDNYVSVSAWSRH